MHTRKRNKAQSVIEYALLAAVVAAAVSTMFYCAKRAVDGKLKLLEEQINISQSED